MTHLAKSVTGDAMENLPNVTHDVNQTLTTTSRLPQEVEVGNAIREVYIWVLVAIGLPANTVCVATVLSMANSPFYVALLAVADSLALVVKLLYHQLYTHDVLNDAGCYFEYFVSFFSCYANWVLVLICLERFVAVCFPFKKQEYFSVTRVHASSVGLGVGLFLCFLPSVFFNLHATSDGASCAGRDSIAGFQNDFWLPILLPSLYFFVPFICVTVFSILIIVRLAQVKSRRQSFRASTSSGSSSAERTISIMLVSAAIVFLVLMLPACIYHLAIKDLFDLSVLKERAKNYLLYQVVTVLSDSSHAVNFFVYFLSAARFRTAFRALLRRCPCCTKFDTGSRDESKSHPSTDTVEERQVIALNNIDHDDSV